MDNVNEDFWLQISTDGGASYVIVEEWNLGDEFVNDVREDGTAIIPGPFTANTRLRFRCDASANGDWVYIDDIFIEGCIDSSTLPEGNNLEITEQRSNPEVNSPVVTEQAAVSAFNLFPNPTSDILNIAFDLQKAGEVEIMVTDFTGKVIQSQRMDGFLGTQQTTIDAARWSAGFYFVHLIADGEVNTKKFVVTK